MGRIKSTRFRSHRPQTHDKAQGHGQNQDPQWLLAIDSLDSWMAPSMDATTESGRNNRRGNNENQATQPQRRPSGVNATQQNKKSGKTNQSVTKPIAVPQNGPPANQSTTEITPQTPVSTDPVPSQVETITFGYDANAPVYNPDLKAISTPAENASRSKPSTMANGKDFWLELRKQVAALQQSGGTAQGG